MSQLHLYLLVIIIIALSGEAADIPLVFDENFSDRIGYESNLCEEKSSLSDDLESIQPVSSPDDYYKIEVALNANTNRSINRSSGNNSTIEMQTPFSGFALSNQSSMSNVTSFSQKYFTTEIPPINSIAVVEPIIISQKEKCFIEGNKNYNESDYLKAIAFYDQAIQLDSQLKEAWFNKGVALCRLERYQDAIDAFNQALVVDPDYSNAKRNRYIALKKTASNSGGEA